MLVSVNVQLMVHESGSKFYETVGFSCDATGRFITVRRWGKMLHYVNGGQVKYEQWPTVKTQAAAAFRLREEKVKPLKAGGPYRGRASSRGFPTGEHDFEHDMLDEALSAHYADSDVREYVLNALAINLKAFCVDAAPVATRVKEIAVPKVEPVRAQDWASW